MTGICKWFDRKRLYGLIVITDESDDLVLDEFLFVKTAVLGPIPDKGARVTFVLNDPPLNARNQKLIATQVRRIDEFQARAPIPSEFQNKDEALYG